jgi:hypothetical protein
MLVWHVRALWLRTIPGPGLAGKRWVVMGGRRACGVMAGRSPAIHENLQAATRCLRGYPAQGRAGRAERVRFNRR